MTLEQIRRHRWYCERKAQAAYEAGKHDKESRWEALWQAYNAMYQRQEFRQYLYRPFVGRI